MSNTVYNTFPYDIETAFIEVARTYLADNLDWFASLHFAHGQMADKVELPQLAFYATNLKEEVFQTGILHCSFDIKFKVDMDVDPLEHVQQLSAAVNDLWQLEDLVTQLTDTELVVAKLAWLESHNPIELGDRYAEQTISGEIIGYSVSQAEEFTGSLFADQTDFNGSYSQVGTHNGRPTYVNLGHYLFWSGANWVLDGTVQDDLDFVDYIGPTTTSPVGTYGGVLDGFGTGIIS